ncbi:MAG: ABC transporter permease [Acidimicrobiales bacterium]|nr:ABC transporter permease [Acidimicrobiales bacterium]
MNEVTLVGLMLYLAALGELIAEKAGVLNLGVEGMMAVGGVAAFWSGTEFGNPLIGLLIAGIAGGLLALVHGLVAVVMGADQVVSGLALTILGLGMSAFLGQDYVSLPAVPQFGALPLGPLKDLRIVGPIVFNQSWLAWVAVGLGISTWFVLERTRVGLGLRAVGESAATADAAGQSVVVTRVAAVVAGGVLAGFGGAYLTLNLAKGWTEGVTAGRGWIAVALVIFGAWRPGRTAVGALLFGGLLALEPRLQTFGVEISPILISMLPYVITIGVLTAFSIQARHRPSAAPAAIGRAYRREER